MVEITVMISAIRIAIHVLIFLIIQLVRMMDYIAMEKHSTVIQT